MHQSTGECKVLHDMNLPCCCLNGGYPLCLSIMWCKSVIIVVMKQEQNASTRPIYREKGWNVAPWSLSLSWRKSFICGTIAFRCGQTTRSPNAKKWTHIFWKWSVLREMTCGGGVPSCNINSQRESSVGDKNQFHEVWSFLSARTTKYRADKRPDR